MGKGLLDTKQGVGESWACAFFSRPFETDRLDSTVPPGRGGLLYGGYAPIARRYAPFHELHPFFYYQHPKKGLL